MTTKPKPYERATDSDGNNYPRGPGTGLSYYGGHLSPETRFGDDRELCERVAKMMNTAYDEGYRAAQANFRRAVGL